MESGFFDFNNGRIYYEVVGDGEPMVLVHGFSLDSRMWQDQVEFFSKKNKVITYDLRGFGKSSTVSGEYSHHEDLMALLDYLKVSHAILIGLSLGGEIAIDFTIEYPQVVIKLVLADSSLGGYSSTVDWNVYAKENGVEIAKINWLNHKVFEVTRNNQKAVGVLSTMLKDYSGWHWLNTDPRKKPTPKAIDRISEIKIPTLILTGEKDLDYYQSIATILNEKIVDSKRLTVSDSGHMVNVEMPDQFNRVVVDFLGQ